MTARDKWLTVAEVAEAWGVGRWAARSRLEALDGALHGTLLSRVGSGARKRHVRVLRSKLERLADVRSRPVAPISEVRMLAAKCAELEAEVERLQEAEATRGRAEKKNAAA